MSSLNENFVVHDVVRHIHDDEYYRPKRSLFDSFHRIRKSFSLYIVIIVISCGVGFLVVNLPDMMQSASGSYSSFSPGQIQSALDGSMDEATKKELKSQFSGMSVKQKAELMKQLKGGR